MRRITWPMLTDAELKDWVTIRLKEKELRGLKKCSWEMENRKIGSNWIFTASVAVPELSNSHATYNDICSP